MEREIWKDISGYEGLYRVSNYGNVFSIRRNRNLKATGRNPYFRFGLSKNGIVECVYLHFIVACEFLNHVSSGRKMVVDHIDNDKTNNKLSNLQIISHRENSSKDKKNGSSKYVGVSWSKNENKWQSAISLDGKSFHLGYFKNEIDAHKKYQNKLNKHLNQKQLK